MIDSSSLGDDFSFPTEIEVHVEVEGHTIRAGTINEIDHTFAYHEDYLARSDAYALDSQLPLASGALAPPAGKLIFNAFWETAPDRWGQWLMDSQVLHSAVDASTERNLTAVDYLLRVRDDLRQGALRFRRAKAVTFQHGGAAEVSKLSGLASLIRAADAVAEGKPTREQLELVVDAGSALGGARPKVAILNESKKLSVAKFALSGNSDSWDVETWEKTTLDMAKSAGISVPKNRLIDIGDRRVLLLERFDRLAGHRIAYSNAFSLLSAFSSWSHSYLDLADWIRRQNPNPASDLQELWRRMTFSRVIGNIDDHLGNHGFLRSEEIGLWSLAPAFDLNPCPHSDATYKMVILPDSLSSPLEQALQVAGKFHLDNEGARVLLASIVNVVSDWRQFAAANNMDAVSVNVMRDGLDSRISEARWLCASKGILASHIRVA